jgi:hypothetical protein
MSAESRSGSKRRRRAGHELGPRDCPAAATLTVYCGFGVMLRDAGGLATPRKWLIVLVQDNPGYEANAPLNQRVRGSSP